MSQASTTIPDTLKLVVINIKMHPYEDDFKDTLASYREVTSQTSKSNPESMGRFHGGCGFHQILQRKVSALIRCIKS